MPGLVFALLTGLTLPQFLPSPWVIACLLIAASLSARVLFKDWPLILMAGALSVIGALISLHAISIRDSEHLAHEAIDHAVVVHADIADLPQASTTGTRLTLKLMDPENSPGIPPRFIVTAWKANWQAGLSGEFEVQLKPIHSLHNFTGFDGEAWAHTTGIGAQGKLLRVRSLSDRPMSMMGRIQFLRDQIREQFRKTLGNHPALPILIALSVGDQSEVTDQDWTVLWLTGVGHLVSISGVHVTLLANCVSALAAWLWRRDHRLCQRLSARLVRGIVGVVAALGYALIAGFSIPTQRTFFMHLVAFLSYCLGREISGLMVWSMALSLVLLLDPFAIHSPSLWLSFGAVGALILVDHGIFGRLGFWASEWRGQWVVNLALLPMITTWFNQLSLISPLANFIAVPWVGYLVTPMTLASMLPGLHLLAWPAAWLMSALNQVLAWLATPSWAAIDLSSPSPSALVLASLTTLLFLLPLSWRGKPILLLGLMPLLFPGDLHPPIVSARIEVIDVGQGLAVTVRTAGHTLLFDTGPRSLHWDAGHRVLLPLFKIEGIDHLDRVVLSHPDMDHVGGYPALQAALPIRQTSAGFLEAGAIDCLRGEHWQWEGVDFVFLYPDTPSHLNTKNSHERNNHACVLQVSVGDHRVLLPADIEEEVEKILSPSLQPVDAVIAPHHGSHTSSTEAFVRALHPSSVIISCGDRNRFHHPDPEVVARWQANGAKIWRTDRWGAIRIELSRSGLKLMTARSQEYSP